MTTVNIRKVFNNFCNAKIICLRKESFSLRVMNNRIVHIFVPEKYSGVVMVAVAILTLARGFYW